MTILVDTCVWSLALRRRQPEKSWAVDRLRSAIEDGRAALMGPIRQEVLSGIREIDQYRRLRQVLGSFPDLQMEQHDFEEAALFHNACRSKGLQGSHTDFLICAVAVRHGVPILTTDRDFAAFSDHLPIQLIEE